MKVVKWIFLVFVIILTAHYLPRALCGVQHWTLNASEKKIIPLLSSPYYLRNPNDLVAFLNQSVFKKRLDTIMKELISIKANLTQKMNKVSPTSTPPRLTQTSRDTSLISAGYLHKRAHLIDLLHPQLLFRRNGSLFNDLEQKLFTKDQLQDECSREYKDAATEMFGISSTGL